MKCPKPLLQKYPNPQNLSVPVSKNQQPFKIKTICYSFLSLKPTSSSFVNLIPSFSSPIIYHQRLSAHFQLGPNGLPKATLEGTHILSLQTAKQSSCVVYVSKPKSNLEVYKQPLQVQISPNFDYKLHQN
ncbi:hypothetical protein V6Z12_A08G078600 [Gossypium hirsutum]